MGYRQIIKSLFLSPAILGDPEIQESKAPFPDTPTHIYIYMVPCPVFPPMGSGGYDAPVVVVCMFACMHGCMYAWMYVCMHACMYVCMYVNLYLYTCYMHFSIIVYVYVHA